MPVPTSLATLSQTPASNSPAGSDAVFPLLDDYLREMFSDFARLRDGANSWLTGVSGTNTITATCSSINALVAGQVFRFVASANTGAVTLNINGLGAKAVTRAGAVALVTGDMPTFAEVGYNGTTFELLNSKHVALADLATSATSATTATSATSATAATTAASVPFSGVTGKPTTAAGYGITDAIATPDFTGSNQSLAANGYQKLPGGLIAQWGKFSTSSGGASSITYPTPFPNAVLSFCATPDIGIGASAIFVNIDSSASSVSAASVYARNATNTAYIAAPVYWIAIGF